MKIVDLNAFLSLPAGTVYFNYVEHNFDLGGTPALMIKGATLEDGFYEATCASTDTGLDVLIAFGKAARNGTSVLLIPQTEKFDGTFRDEQLYAVYEPADAKQLITRLLKGFGETGLLDKGMVSMLDQIINPTGCLLYEAEIFAETPRIIPFSKESQAAADKLLDAVDKNGPLYQAAVKAIGEVDIVPTPGSKEMTVKADAETAQRLCVHVIRPNKHGVNINYGRLAVGHLDGLPFVGQVESLIAMGLKCIYVERIPKFVEHIKLSVSWKDESTGEDLHATIYALAREDIASLGMALSKNNRTVMAVYMDCFLQVWSYGNELSERRTIDKFGRNMTPEQIEESKF